MGDTHINGYAWRDVSTLPIQAVTIDEIITYTERGNTSQIDFRTVISTAGTMNLTRGSRTVPGVVLPEIDRRLGSIFERLGTYTHTNTSPTNTTVDFFGSIFTRQAVMTVFDGTNVIDMPLEILYNDGVPHHRLLFPYPVDASIAYTSVTVRYFLNPFIDATTGGSNSASSITLRTIGSTTDLTLPMSDANRTALTTAIANSDTVQAHFTQRNGTPVVFDITAAVAENTNSANFTYAGYVRTDITLMNYTYAIGTTAPADNSQITLVIGGGSLARNTPFAVGVDGLVNAPTQEEVTANEFLRADNTWEAVQAPIADTVTLTSGSNSWTMTADTGGTLTIALNGTNAFRLTPNATTNNVDLAVTGDISGNQTIT